MEDTTSTTTATTGKRLAWHQYLILGLALIPMIAVGVAGGIGTYSNISGAYGSGTAVGALAAGEGATAVLGFLYLGVTLLGQTAPKQVRLGLWALPATAAVMGATAATEGIGQTIVYAATPLAITAAAEGIAFLARRVVVYREGRDIAAEERAATVIRDLAYHQARAAAHPKKGAKKRSELKAWKLARKVGNGDPTLGTQLLDVQRERLTQGADIALERMFTPGISTTSAAALTTSASTTPALPAASAHDAMTSRAHELTIQADENGRPNETASDQAEETESIRPDFKLVQGEKTKKPSIAADVRQMVDKGAKDVQYVLAAIATRHGRDADDKALKSTVNKYFREASAAQTTDARPEAQGPYL
ncbi:conjugal transfer protein [Streptomyces sp. NPDC055059]